MTRQLELFSQIGERTSPPSSATMVLFPLSRRRKLVRDTAGLLRSRKTGEGQQSAWSRTIDKLKAEMSRHGASQTDADRQLQEFHSAVSAELVVSQNLRPGGAA